MLPALLSNFKKRNYTPYKHTRTKIWEDRVDLLEYELALELDKLLDDMMEEQPETVISRPTKTPKRKVATPGAACSHTNPLQTPSSGSNGQIKTPKIDWDDEASVLDEEIRLVETKKEEKMKAQFQEWIYPKWSAYVTTEETFGVRIRPPGFERFDAGMRIPLSITRCSFIYLGYVYTTMVHKASRSFGPLKEYELELEILDTLLKQRFWCRGKRGKWYTRRAIVLGHLVKATNIEERKVELNHRMLDGLADALLDDDTGLGIVISMSTVYQSLTKDSFSCSMATQPRKTPHGS